MGEKEIVNSMKCCQTRKCEDCFYQKTMDCMETMLQDAITLIDSKREVILEFNRKLENGELIEV